MLPISSVELARRNTPRYKALSTPQYDLEENNRPEKTDTKCRRI